MSNSTSNLDYDIAIVGLGPVGAVLGNLLGPSGLKIAIYDREPDVYPLPRAIAFDGEIMRLFQTIELTDALKPSITVGGAMQFVELDSGEVLFSRGQATDDGPQGWAHNYAFYQPEFERILRKGLERYDNVSVFLRHEVYAIAESSDQSEPFISYHVENMQAGSLSEKTARYLVGCDGARSLVRRLIGAEYTDLGLHEPWVVVDLITTADTPNVPLPATQFCDKEKPVTFVRGIENRIRFEIKIPKDITPQEATSDGYIWGRIQAWVTQDNATIDRAAFYTFHSLIANKWRKGNLLIAGDSAHQTPPFRGQGMCTGLRDVANLSWKLERILKRQAKPQLLDSYYSERHPHTETIIQQAVHFGKLFSADTVEERREMVKSNLGPQNARKSVKLGHGVLSDSPFAGELSTQPKFTNNCLLDTAIGYNFALVARKVSLADADRRAIKLCTELDIKIIEADESVGRWLDELETEFILLRPDRYIYSLFGKEDALSVVTKLGATISETAIG